MPAKMTIVELQNRLAAQKQRLSALEARRKTVAAQLAKVDGEIAALTGSAAPAPVRRKKTTKKAAKKTTKKAAKKTTKKTAKKTAKKAAKKVGRPKKAVKKTVKKAVKKAAPKAAAGRRRRATGRPLVDYLRDVLAGKPKGMRVKEIVAAVLKAGYPTQSKDFYGICATALRDEKTFTKIKRGVYKLK